MKYVISSLLIAFIFQSNLASQSIKSIKVSGEYLYGYGESEIHEKADKIALSDLISQISVTVSSTTGFGREQNSKGYKEYANSIIKTYSSVSLNTSLRIEEEKKGVYKVLRYIPKGELTKIFEERRNTILAYTKAGLEAEKKIQIDDALRNFYWANILLRSHPEHDVMRYTTKSGENELLKVFIPNKINDVLTNLNIEIIDRFYNPYEKHSKYTLSIKYKDKAIQSLDYTYKKEKAWSGKISANNGLACIDFYGNDAKPKDNLKIRVQYMYKDKAMFDKDVQRVFSSNIDIPYFNRNEINASLKKIRVAKGKGDLKVESINFVTPKSTKARLQELIYCIKDPSKKVDPTFFTIDGLEVYNKLIKYGKADILKHNNELELVQVDDETLVRSIPMCFSFSKNRKFIEDVVFVLNEDGKIKDINFSLGKSAIDDLLSKSERFATIKEKYFLLRFLENYKTAYCLKRLDFLEQIFDEDALIIVGSVLKKMKSTDVSAFASLTRDKVVYQQLTKSEYMSRLERVFAKNEFVNVHFEHNTIKKARADMSIYGIQIAQSYNSESYADRGYLFLMVDLRDTLKPIVHVRTWQPHKNEDGSVYGLKDFKFRKI
ncbi:LPP20 family lipoprotein [Ancylomarina sp. DW003]|nr:LPP20 family lipoprotein [Ancylomarina sp. DW003]MDE5422429.1 LPP20 family lipoprotein [Ancylomarina sp. DW003]